ncbi:MAG: efflux RND transporter permease subunit [Nitrospirae bacterium]|nr:efflux RND transporter permease subunit [Candidatus Troglogloeales bacterium]
MLRAVIEFSLRFRGVVVALSCIVLAYGFYVADHAKLDVFPNFIQPQVVVQTEAPGLSPEQVEALVTRPIESAVSGLGHLESVRSESIQGLSIITAVFDETTDIFIARQMLGEQLVSAATLLPLGVKTPKMTPLTSSTMDLLTIGLTSETLSPMALRTFADWTLKPRLLAVPGVAKASLFGGEVREVQIQVHPDRLQAFDLSLSDVLSAARMSTGVLGAGFIETDNQRIIIQTEGQAVTPHRLGEVVVAATQGSRIRLKDVARVMEGAEQKFGDTLIQGKPGVLMTLSSQYGANTMEGTKALEAAPTEMKPVFAKEGIILFDRLHRPATFIETALKHIRHSLLLGGLLVAVVLFLFLGQFRTAFISITAIPLSLLTAVILLDKLGQTLNTITLGGLAIAIGEVVDDAIIDVENIVRRLRENQTQPTPRPVFHVVLSASLEVRSAVVYATFIVAVVFLPVLTLTGLQGKFFAPLALSYILAIMASLAVALTLTPALSYWFFANGVRDTHEPSLQVWLKGAYCRVLGLATDRPRTVVATVLLIGLFAMTMLPSFGGEFLPEFREGHFVLQVSAAPGTSLPEMLRMGRSIAAALLTDKRIATVEQQVGRAEAGEDPWGPNRSEFHVDLNPMSGDEEAKMANVIRGMLGKFPGIQFEVLTFLGDRIGETIAGETAPVVVSIFGDDLDLLDAKAYDVARVLRAVPGAADVQVKSPPGAPRIAVRLRPERLTQFGFRPVDVLEAVQTAFQGSIVAQTYQGSQVSNVAVLLDPRRRKDPEAIGALLLRNAHGIKLPLRALAEIYQTSGRSLILHDGARRRQTVTANPGARDVASFVADAKKQIAAKVQFPAGVYAVWSGAAQQEEKAQQELVVHAAIAAAGILLLMVMAFGNMRNLMLVLMNIPFALVGGLIAISLTGTGRLTMGALVGFVTLFGITMRNSIMMISHYEYLVREEGAAWGIDTAMRGASERLIPILMTALVTALGLLPLAFGGNAAGREIEGPMAIVILGGLMTSTILNLLVLPPLALWYGRFTIRQNEM